MPEKSIIHTSQAPQAIGPYSQATCLDTFVFTSGQIPLDPLTGAIVEGGIDPQTRQALANLRAVLEAAGSSLDKVLKTTVFLRNLEDFATVNEIYAASFRQKPPARSCVEVSQLPKGALIEIEAIASV
jgi:2-iminobutanoate/2-iminopropanoate deaminase